MTILDAPTLFSYTKFAFKSTRKIPRSSLNLLRRLEKNVILKAFLYQPKT